MSSLGKHSGGLTSPLVAPAAAGGHGVVLHGGAFSRVSLQKKMERLLCVIGGSWLLSTVVARSERPPQCELDGLSSGEPNPVGSSVWDPVERATKGKSVVNVAQVWGRALSQLTRWRGQPTAGTRLVGQEEEKEDEVTGLGSLIRSREPPAFFFCCWDERSRDGC